MDGRYTAKARRLVDALLDGPGDAAPALRRAVEGRAAEAGGRAAPSGELPAALVAYVDKVARNAYKVTDEDIAALRQAGYSQDAIFEITLSAALGAGMARLERGLAALKGGQ